MEKRRSGQKFRPRPAADENAIAAAADLLSRKSANIDSPARSEFGANACVIKLRNSTGSDLRAGDVLGVGDELLSTLTNEQLWFDGEVPDADHTALAVALRPMPQGSVHPCQIIGACLAYVNVAATTDKGIALSSGETRFKSRTALGDLGRVLTAPTSTGEQLVAVVLDAQSEELLKRVKLTESIAALAVGTAEVMVQTCGASTCSFAVPGSPTSLEICNATGRKLWDDEELWVTRLGDCWVALPTPRPLRMRGTLAARLACAGSTPTVTFVRYLDCPNWTGNEGTRSYDNPLGLGAASGSVVFAQWDETGAKWSLDQVEHEEKTFVTDVFLYPTGNCIAGDLLDVCVPKRYDSDDLTENHCLIDTTDECP